MAISFSHLAYIIIILLLVFILLLQYLTIKYFRREKNNIHQAIKKSSDHTIKQVDAFIKLNHAINPVYPLPDIGEWAASADFLLFLYKLILERKPEQVLEVSSGTSSVIIGYALQKTKSGRFKSLEHLEEYKLHAEKLIKLHDLQDVGEVVHAPLVEHKIDGENWLWYDKKSIDESTKYDLVVIDGPPSGVQNHARFPALPLLFNQIKKNGLILLDDGNRSDEKEIVEKWNRMYEELEIEYFPFCKGAHVIKKLN